MHNEPDGPTQKYVGQFVKELPKQSDSKIKLFAVLFVVGAAVLIAHWPALSAQALSFDDDQYLTENLLVQNPSLASARQFFTEILEPSTVKGYYQPLTMFSLMADYALGGRSDNLQPFHRTSLALHLMNTALVIMLLHLLFGRIWISAGAGLLFGLHPMTVETIAWVGERKTLLAAFFALWSLVLYVRFSHKGNWRLYLGCLAMYVLALMSKPTSIPLPLLILLLDFWPLKRLNKRAILEKLPFFAVGIASAVVTYISQSQTATAALPSEYGMERIPLILCHNIIFYPYKMIWPVNLSSHYGYPKPLGLSNPMVLTGLIGTCVLIALLIFSLRRTRAAITGWLFFFIAILPTMQIVGFSNVIASDKFAYLPSVGLLMALTSFLAWFCGTGKKAVRHWVAVIVVLVLAGAETVATRRYLVHWADTVSLHEYMLTMTPKAAPVHYNLANTFFRQGKFDKAITHFYQASLSEPNTPEVYNNLGIALSIQGRLDEAISHFNQALQLKPDDFEVCSNLGTALMAQGKLDEAISYFTKSLQLKPDFVKAHIGLGLALAEQGKLDEAIDHYQQGLRFEPDFATAHYSLGNALRAKGKLNEAMNHYSQALNSNPNYPGPLVNMAQILSTHPDPNIRDTSMATEFAKGAAKLTGYQNAFILNTLADCYAASGQFDQAIKTAQKAMELAAASQNEALANHLRKQIELYKKAKP
jgi:tetratricopeptide (TPR) repeat protein